MKKFCKYLFILLLPLAAANCGSSNAQEGKGGIYEGDSPAVDSLSDSTGTSDSSSTPATSDASDITEPSESSSTPESSQASEVSSAPDVELMKQALLTAYPDMIKDIKDNYVILANGEKVIFDDGRKKEFKDRLDHADVEDMFYDVYEVYPEGSKPAYLFDPGRARSDALFMAMYGKSASEVQRNTTPVPWQGGSVAFMKVNGAADALKAVAKELEQHPELKKYLKSSGAFNWRKVRGSDRMSPHSFATAFDIGVDTSDFWQWGENTTDELKKIGYKNRFPRKLVEIFEKHGFIWGGAWYHYDTMHFEYRPEILEYARLKGRK